jgi:hypothetical protein
VESGLEARHLIGLTSIRQGLRSALYNTSGHESRSRSSDEVCNTGEACLQLVTRNVQEGSVLDRCGQNIARVPHKECYFKPSDASSCRYAKVRCWRDRLDLEVTVTRDWPHGQPLSNPVLYRLEFVSLGAGLISCRRYPSDPLSSSNRTTIAFKLDLSHAL